MAGKRSGERFKRVSTQAYSKWIPSFGMKSGPKRNDDSSCDSPVFHVEQSEHLSTLFKGCLKFFSPNPSFAASPIR